MTAPMSAANATMAKSLPRKIERTMLPFVLWRWRHTTQRQSRVQARRWVGLREKCCAIPTRTEANRRLLALRRSPLPLPPSKYRSPGRAGASREPHASFRMARELGTSKAAPIPWIARVALRKAGTGSQATGQRGGSETDKSSQRRHVSSPIDQRPLQLKEAGPQNQAYRHRPPTAARPRSLPNPH